VIASCLQRAAMPSFIAASDWCLRAPLRFQSESIREGEVNVEAILRRPRKRAIITLYEKFAKSFGSGAASRPLVPSMLVRPRRILV
jgi:hypothetical protein